MEFDRSTAPSPSRFSGCDGSAAPSSTKRRTPMMLSIVFGVSILIASAVVSYLFINSKQQLALRDERIENLEEALRGIRSESQSRMNKLTEENRALKEKEASNELRRSESQSRLDMLTEENRALKANEASAFRLLAEIEAKEEYLRTIDEELSELTEKDEMTQTMKSMQEKLKEMEDQKKELE